MPLRTVERAVDREEGRFVVLARSAASISAISLRTRLSKWLTSSICTRHRNERQSCSFG